MIQTLINLNIPFVSAAMDTVTESKMAIAIAQEGGIGVLHKNMTIDQQSNEVRKVKRSESGMILDPITVSPQANIREVLSTMKENKIIKLEIRSTFIVPCRSQLRRILSPSTKSIKKTVEEWRVDITDIIDSLILEVWNDIRGNINANDIPVR